MKAYKHLVKFAFQHCYTVSVFDGEVWEVKRSNAYKKIIDCIESVEEAQLRIRDSEGNVIAWALVSAYGLDDDETVIDHTDNEFMQLWDKHYNSTMV
jgi:hypothetical protein